MTGPAAKEAVVAPLLSWFRRNARDLPWRRGYDPYHVLVSEFMLQQTQMDRVVVYFLEWIRRFPTLKALARADEAEALKLWEGLGYYSRCRNLLAAARTIVETWNGRVPEDPASLMTLPGIGPYSAGAVSSIAYNRPVPAVDANARRVVSRLEARPFRNDRDVASFLAGIIPDDEPRSFNQALMELGALVCTAARPSCDVCPLNSACKGRSSGEIPLTQSAAVTRRPTRPAAAAVLFDDGKVFLRRRPDAGLWAGMSEFPWEETAPDESPESAARRAIAPFYGETGAVGVIGPVSHAFTGNRIRLTGVLLRLYPERELPENPVPTHGRWVPLETLSDETLPAGSRKLRDLLLRDVNSRSHPEMTPEGV